MSTGAAATRGGPARAAASGGALERARKVLLHEQRMGCLDRAVVGGLEHFFLQLSAGEPAERPAGAWLRAAARRLAAYARRPAHERQAIIAQLLERLSRLEVAAPAGTASASVATPASGPVATATTRPAAVPPLAQRPAVAAKADERHPALSPMAPVTALPGVGPKAAAALEKLEIHSLRDLLYHLPRRHVDRRSISRIADLIPGQLATIVASVWQVQTKRSPIQRRLITEAILQDESGFCHAVWFNQPYLVRTLSRPGKVLFSGKVEAGYGGSLQLVSPEFEFDSDELLHTGRLVPFYPKREGVSDKQLRAWMRQALAATATQLQDPVPPAVLNAEAL